MNGNVPNKKTCVKKFIKMQHKNSISWILWKIQVKIHDFEKKVISWICISIALNLYYTGSFIGGISFHNLKYLDKPIKLLKMKSNEIIYEISEWPSQLGAYGWIKLNLNSAIELKFKLKLDN